jgi:hypothetical protein
LPGNPIFRVGVMTKGEFGWNVFFYVASIPLFLAAQTGHSTTGLIRTAIGDISAAVEDYQAQKGEHVWWVVVEGRSNSTLERVDGRYRIVDAAGISSFFVEDGSGRTVTIGSNSTADWSISTLGAFGAGRGYVYKVVSC